MARSEGQNQILLSVDLTDKTCKKVHRLLCTLGMEWRLHQEALPVVQKGQKRKESTTGAEK